MCSSGTGLGGTEVHLGPGLWTARFSRGAGAPADYPLMEFSRVRSRVMLTRTLQGFALIHTGALLHPVPWGEGHWLWFLCPVVGRGHSRREGRVLEDGGSDPWPRNSLLESLEYRVVSKM